MRIVIGVLVVLAVAAGVSGVASYSYHLGLAQGVAQSGQTPAPAPGTPYPMYPSGYGWGWHGPFGFGFLGFLWPLLWIVLVVFLLRGLYWGRRGYWMGGGHGYGAGGSCGGGGPRWLEEWHRRVHESKSQTGTV